MDHGKAGGEVGEDVRKGRGRQRQRECERERGKEKEERARRNGRARGASKVKESTRESPWTSVVSVEARLLLRCLYEFDEEPVSLERAQAASRTSIQSKFT